MGKDKSQPRTKGNQRPSSSKSAAAFLEQNVGSLSLNATGSDAHRLTGYVPIDQDPDAAQIHPEIRVQLRLLEKKDATTKHKALTKLMEVFPTLEEADLWGALPYWPRIYARLCRDEDKKVREMSQRVHGSLCSRCGKQLLPHLKQLLPHWITSQNDLCDAVAFSATTAFQSTFPSAEKQAAAYQFAWQEIIQLVRDRLSSSPLPKPGSSSTPKEGDSPDDSEHIRHVCASLRAVAHCIQPFVTNPTSKTSLCELLREKVFWRHGVALGKLHSQQQVLENSEWMCVHAAYCQVTSQVCQHLPELVSEGGYCAVQMCDLTLRHIGDTSPALVGELWPAVLSLFRVADFDCWRFVSFRKLFLPELHKLLEQGVSHGVARQVAPNFLPIFSHLPLGQWVHEDADWATIRDLFRVFRAGLAREKAELSFMGGEVCALVAAYLECGRYFLVQCLKQPDAVETRAECLLEDVLLEVWREALLSEKVTRNYYSTVNEHLADLLLAFSNPPEDGSVQKRNKLCEKMVSWLFALVEENHGQSQFDVKLMHLLMRLLHGETSLTGAHSKRVTVAFSSTGANMEPQREGLNEVPIVWTPWKIHFFTTLRQRLQLVVDATQGHCLLAYLLTCYALSQRDTSSASPVEENASLVKIILLSESLVEPSVLGNEEVAVIVSCALANMLQRLSEDSTRLTVDTYLSKLIQEDRILVFMHRILSKLLSMFSSRDSVHCQVLLNTIHNHLARHLLHLWEGVFHCDANSEELLVKVEKLMVCVFSPTFTYFPHLRELREEVAAYLNSRIEEKVAESVLEKRPVEGSSSWLLEESKVLLLLDAGLHMGECLEQVAAHPRGGEYRLNCVGLLAQLFAHHALLWGWRSVVASSGQERESSQDDVDVELYGNLIQGHICHEVKHALLAYGSKSEDAAGSTSSESVPTLSGSLRLVWRTLGMGTASCGGVLATRHFIHILVHFMHKTADVEVRQRQANVLLLECLRSAVRPLCAKVVAAMRCASGAIDFHVFMTPSLFLSCVQWLMALKTLKEEFGEQVFTKEDSRRMELVFLLMSSLLEGHDLAQLSWGSDLCEEVFQYTLTKCIPAEKYASVTRLQHLCHSKEDPLELCDTWSDAVLLYHHAWAFCLPKKQIEWESAWMEKVNVIPIRWSECSQEEFQEMIRVYLPAGSAIRMCLLDTLSHSISNLLKSNSPPASQEQVCRVVHLVTRAVQTDAVKYFPLLQHLLTVKELHPDQILVQSPEDLQEHSSSSLEVGCCLLSSFVACLDDFHLFSEEMADFVLCYTVSLTSLLFSPDIPGTFLEWSRREWFVLAHLVLQVAERMEDCVQRRAAHWNNDHLVREMRDFFAQEIVTVLLKWWSEQVLLKPCQSGVETQEEHLLIWADVCKVLRSCSACPAMLPQHVKDVVKPHMFPDDPCLHLMPVELLSAWNFLMPLIQDRRPSVMLSGAVGVELLLTETAQLIDKRMQQHAEEDVSLEVPLALSRALDHFPEELHKLAITLKKEEFWKQVLTPVALMSSPKEATVKATLESQFPALLSYLLAQSVCLHLLGRLSDSAKGKLVFNLNDSLRGKFLRSLDLIHALLPKTGELSVPPTLHRQNLQTQHRGKTNLWLHMVNVVTSSSPQVLQQSPLAALLKLSPDTERTSPRRWLLLRQILMQTCVEMYVVMPMLVRRWWLNQPKKQAESVARYVEQQFSTFLVEHELAQISTNAAVTLRSPEMSDLKVRTNAALKEVLFELKLADSHSMKLEIRYPPAYPLMMLVVEETKRLNISEAQWRGWMMQITHQNINLLSSILLFRENFRRRLEGAEECAICYSVLQWNDSSLPKMKCKTCQKRFHHACMFQWFRSTPLPTCPLCREVFR